jgi:hypothetical protein
MPGNKFKQKGNPAVFTLRQIIEGKQPVLLVIHDKDNSWKFLTGASISPADFTVTSLQEIIKTDVTLSQLHDLPPGWQASREKTDSEWNRIKVG